MKKMHKKYVIYVCGVVLLFAAAAVAYYLPRHYEKQADDLLNKATTLFHTGKYQQGLLCVEKANKLYQKAKQTALFDAILDNEIDFFQMYSNFAMFLAETQLFPEAQDYFKRAINCFNPETDSRERFVVCWGNVAIMYECMGKYDESVKVFRKTIQLAHQYGLKKREAQAYLKLFYVLKKTDCDNIVLWNVLKKTDAEVKANFNSSSIEYASLYKAWASRYAIEEEYEKAETCLKKALKIASGLNDHAELSAIYNNLGLVENMRKDYDQAIKYYKKALENDTPYDGISRAITYENIGCTLAEQKKYKEAALYIKKATTIFKKYYGPSHPKVIALEKKCKNLSI